MKRVNLFELYQFGQRMWFFERLTPATLYSEIASDCASAECWLDYILRRDYAPLSDVREDAEFLRSFCLKVMKEADRAIAEQHAIIKYRFDRFENVLATELAGLNIYFVTKVNAYDTDELLSNGRAALTETTVKGMDADSLRTFEEGTRCLGLKLPTSAGFQLLRSVEGVMHTFYDVLSGGAARPAKRNMGDYIAAMEKLSTVDPRMLDVLRSIKNLRRNPLMHPEQFLDMDEAIETFDVAKSAISAMVRMVNDHKKASTKVTP
jgi:hypothetical protein